MAAWKRTLSRVKLGALRPLLARVDVLAIFAALAGLGAWLEAELLLVASAIGLPALLALSSLARGVPQSSIADQPALAGRDRLLAALRVPRNSHSANIACLAVQIPAWEVQIDRFGSVTCSEITARIEERLGTVLRREDVVAQLGDARFGIALAPSASFPFATQDAIAKRLQAALAEPLSVRGTTLRLESCIGHAKWVSGDPDEAAATLDAAEQALGDALHHGAGSVTAFSSEVGQAWRRHLDLTSHLEDALAENQIRAWFQPQVRTETGVLSGFEALARWHHPKEGVLAPSQFLSAVEETGHLHALGRRMLTQALEALVAWDAAGVHVPSVSVNFSAAELRDPGFADAVKWGIDRFDLRPGRLTVEILETVAADPVDPNITDTLQSLHRHGVGLDLDDFGIGQSSLASIARFGVNRIKIDRSFVTGVEATAERRAMVAAILSMADHLDVETLAEGVETEAAQRVLADMGCHHVQGFEIARPMPFEATLEWIRTYTQDLNPTLPAPRHFG